MFSFTCSKQNVGVGSDSVILLTHQQRCYLSGVSCISYVLFLISLAGNKCRGWQRQPHLVDSLTAMPLFWCQLYFPCFVFLICSRKPHGSGSGSPILVTHEQRCHLSAVNCISYASRCFTCWKTYVGRRRQPHLVVSLTAMPPFYCQLYFLCLVFHSLEKKHMV